METSSAIVTGREEKAADRPQPQAPARMLVIEQCRGEAAGCPNLLIPTSAYAREIEEWAERNRVEERLQAWLLGGPARFHQKLHLAVAGCPNACSRPQIADLAAVGAVRPMFDPAQCAECGACEEACPDGAINCAGGPPVFDHDACQGCKRCARACPEGCITLAPVWVRVLAGGKLGRRPRLAEVIGEADGPEEFLNRAAALIEDYLDHAPTRERFADYWVRGREKANGARAHQEGKE